MLKVRLIPVVLMRNGRVVQSKRFSRYQALGNASTVIWRLSNWSADELIYLDISRQGGYDLNRDDLNFPNRHEFHEILADVAGKCFMPLTVGGGISGLGQIHDRLKAGADKVSINTAAVRNPGLIGEAAREFGSQCVVVSIDAKRTDAGHEVFVDGGRAGTGRTPADWAKEAQERGAGEILLNSIDRDGGGQGYDLEALRAVCGAVRIPVIALGGVGEWGHFREGVEAGASAVAAANIFQYTENSVHLAKKHLHEAGVNVRAPAIKTVVPQGGM